MTGHNQVICSDVGSLLVVDRQGIETLMVRIDQNDRGLMMEKLFDERFRHPHGEEQNAVDPVPHDMVSQRFFQLIGMIDAEQEKVAVEFAELGLNALKNLHEKERREKRYDRHDRIGTLPGETSCVGMRSIAQTVGDAKDSFARFL
jgi:hypothetical protein